MPPLGVKDLTMPAAAFTMAIVLGAHVYTSINQARREADEKREEILYEERERRNARYNLVRAKHDMKEGSPISSARDP
ncbi:hypothetical protein IAR55_007023 [Kwoniella newhampshirensis]|uniref:Uncharacterized protein n=1 Tax=Kwoniella newhampshirensis TaxID=1651941 RepID=A0AAW0YDV2_9TREE